MIGWHSSGLLKSVSRSLWVRIYNPEEATMLSEDNLWSEKEVSDYLGLSIKALQKRRNKRQPPTFLKLGRTVRYRKEDVEACLTEIRPQTKETKSTPVRGAGGEQ
jgi:predicted DNA-binding transcriptional regulator AlpA